jgi:hypothetical protein
VRVSLARRDAHCVGGVGGGRRCPPAVHIQGARRSRRGRGGEPLGHKGIETTTYGRLLKRPLLVIISP